MKEQVIKGSITISRDSNNEVHIRIRDETARVQFVDMHLSLEAYALLITGLSEIKGDVVVKGLDVVGKTKIRDRRSVVYTGSARYDRKTQERWIEDNCQEDGWIVDASLGSQDSVKYNHDTQETILNYGVYKYVDIQ